MQEILGFYPLWYVPDFGSAYILAVTAVTHVLFSHTAVGASFLLAYLTTKAVKENREEELYPYIKKYIFSLLITSYIMGSITGPGIWFSATVASPRGISTLIHNFVWMWAAEWVWFVTEVVIIYLLYYLMDKIDRKTYMYLTWIFAGASFMTLALIVGILSFMLSPGSQVWFESGNVMDAFYNKNYFPHVFMRAFFMVSLGGLMGIAIATRLKDQQLKAELNKTMSLWGIGGTLFGSMMFLMYIATTPDNARFTLDFVITDAFKMSISSMVALVLLFFVYVYLKAKPIKFATPVIVMMVLVLSLALWPEEKIRETLRKPYVAGEFVWVNQIIAKDVPSKGITNEIGTINENGFLASHPFVPEKLKNVTEENKVDAGRAVAMVQCSSCHSVDTLGPRPLVKKLNGLTNPDIIYNFISTRLSGHPEMGGAPYMPQLVGTEEERRALAAYLAKISADYQKSIGNGSVNVASDEGGQ